MDPIFCVHSQTRFQMSQTEKKNMRKVRGDVIPKMRERETMGQLKGQELKPDYQRDDIFCHPPKSCRFAVRVLPSPLGAAQC